VLLSIKENIEASLLEVFQVELEGKFTEEGALFQIVGMGLEDL